MTVINRIALLSLLSVLTVGSTFAQALPQRVAQNLDLSEAQREAIKEKAPSDSWELASALQEVLTDQQKEKLMAAGVAATAYRRGVRDGLQVRARAARRPATRSPAPRGRSSMMVREMQLSDEQKAQMEDIREAYRERLAELKESHESGSINQETYKERARAIRMEARRASSEVLTDEQRERAQKLRSDSQNRARSTRGRRAAPGSMSETLGLSPEQEETMRIHAAIRAVSSSPRMASARMYRRPPR